MSENTAGTCSICGTYHPTSLACPNVSLAYYMRGQQPDPTVSALDALRQAVVAQTALLRSLSEQMRLGFEQEQNITVVAPSELLKGIEAKLNPDPFPKELKSFYSGAELRKATGRPAQGTPNQSLTSKTHYQLRKEKAARRKAKR